MKPILLGLPAEAVGSRADILNIDITFLVEITEDFAESGKDLANILGLFRLSIGLIDDLDVEVETFLVLGGKRLAAYDPIVGTNIIDRDGGQFAFFM